MSLPVHLVPALVGVAVGDVIEVTGDEAHHAVAVRRIRVGEQVVLTDGAGIAATGTVTGTGKRRLDVEVTALEEAALPTPQVTVVQALPKGDRGELAVEVLTEIGVQRIVPWAAERSVAVWRGERAAKSHAKWANTAREAAKQARRSWFPEVTELAGTAAVVEMLAGVDTAVVLHEAATVPLVDVPLSASGTIALVVGPEGGISDKELELFTAAGVTPVRMGQEVMRTSTAGVAAVAALLSRTARWGSSPDH
ncbi:16S rRNA (uracil(1498)-N(3))-methyltransferase [Nocardioides sp. AE5]|uniref:16S rRNA (uracil(1498)-N(3))-methyltransferase n=1 Tax=Nocardioides sp. AE5 TaxID=2962573 RepID=UPI0028813CB0|nr:16S rRNA (uracil(1498)-N(3))-methyltransferase [Nocardioides sp. AE5]MDT0201080.1 16S rRNA (uracil(1498)-N(3))-methyltransferase [Nocardioides sp. AE5]